MDIKELGAAVNSLRSQLDSGAAILGNQNGNVAAGELSLAFKQIHSAICHINNAKRMMSKGLFEGEINWQRVIDEGYLCGFSDVSQEDAQKKANTNTSAYGLASIDTLPIEKFNSAGFHWDYCAIRRVPNEIQPHFGGGMPEGLTPEDNVTVYFEDGDIFNAIASYYTWRLVDKKLNEKKGIIAFIVHKPITGSL